MYSLNNSSPQSLAEGVNCKFPIKMTLPNEWLTDDSWYNQNIEKPIREIVKNLRNNGREV